MKDDEAGSPGPDEQTWARALLDADRVHTQQHLADLLGDFAGIVAASADSNADDEHDPEGATIAFERSQIGALVAQAQEHLREVEAALARLEDGRYGLCESCGQPVGRDRLEARPVARTCITCAGVRRRA